MKEKVKRFFLEKRELLVFLGVLAVIFATVISVVSIAMKNAIVAGGDPVTSSEAGMLLPSSTQEKGSEQGANASTDVGVTPTVISLPVSGDDYIIVRRFFDTSKTTEELASAIINTGSYYVESKGVSYSKEDNQSFEVKSIYSGNVESIIYDEANGYTVTIDHGDGLKSAYKSLSEVMVEVQDEVTSVSIIGMAGTRVFDTSAGVHVHVEVMLNETYLDLSTLVGKEIEEVASMK